MDGGSFYSHSSGHYQPLFSSLQMMQQGIHRAQQSGWSVPDHGGYDSPGGSLSFIGINQKLNRVLELFEEQRRESIATKGELATL